jgi:predicted Rossmann fold nucleotide-binding protein DprA/Smf involved in DNA uptake
MMVNRPVLPCEIYLHERYSCCLSTDTVVAPELSKIGDLVTVTCAHGAVRPVTERAPPTCLVVAVS